MTSLNGPRAAISRRILRQEICDHLVKDILTGRLAPGDRITESRLARRFHVSHAPVREALRDMEMLGFVVSSPFRGAAVRSFSVEDLVQIYPIRAVLEGLAAREAASRIDAAGLVRLRKLLGAMRRAAARGDARAEVDADIAFHLAIVEASGNAFLKQIWELMQWATTGFITVSRSVRPVIERHLSVLEALEAQNPAAAETAMRSHIEEAAQRLRATIERDRELSDKLGLVRPHTPKRETAR